MQNEGHSLKSLTEKFNPKYDRLTKTLSLIYKEEGFKSLWKGLSAGLQRQIVFCGLRVGCYPTIRDFIVGDSSPSLKNRITAGLITGAFGIIIASPCDVVKVKLQSQVRNSSNTNTYKGSLEAYNKIYKVEGILGFYSGLTPNILRCSIMNSAELASYDHIKSFLMTSFNLNSESKVLQIYCAVVASLIAVFFSSPLDVVKTRIMSVNILITVF